MVWPAPTALPPLPSVPASMPRVPRYPDGTIRWTGERTAEPMLRALPPEVIDACHAWPVQIGVDEGELYLRCVRCTQSCISLSRHGIPYQVPAFELLAAVTGHVLQAHRTEVES